MRSMLFATFVGAIAWAAGISLTWPPSLFDSSMTAAGEKHGDEFRYFFNELRPHGQWRGHARYGWTWTPRASRRCCCRIKNSFWSATSCALDEIYGGCDVERLGKRQSADVDALEISVNEAGHPNSAEGARDVRQGEYIAHSGDLSQSRFYIIAGVLGIEYPDSRGRVALVAHAASGLRDPMRREGSPRMMSVAVSRGAQKSNWRRANGERRDCVRTSRDQLSVFGAASPQALGHLGLLR